MFRWLAGRGASEKAVQRALARIAPAQWAHVLQTLPCLRGFDADELTRLQYKTAWFLASKSFSSAHGLVLTDQIMLSIAAQAALPILALEPAVYEGWTQVIVYPDAFVIEREVIDEAGVVHLEREPVSGEAWEGGPVILSWADARDGDDENGNVVIHEFAHKIDLYNGQADGVPSLGRQRGLQYSEWQRILSQSLKSFRRQLERIETQIPADIDLDSSAADPWYERLPMDAYAATDEAEFFAVSTEAFFMNPHRLRLALPDWYAMLRQFYQQDPAGRQR